MLRKKYDNFCHEFEEMAQSEPKQQPYFIDVFLNKKTSLVWIFMRKISQKMPHYDKNNGKESNRFKKVNYNQYQLCKADLMDYN